MLQFRRLELKYLVDRTTRTALEQDLSALMPHDKYSQQDGGYYVRSIYFDTPDYMVYHQKLAGFAQRHKLRVRAYGREPHKAAFIRLEVKSRYLNYIDKIAVDFPTKYYPKLEPAILGRGLPSADFLYDDTVSKEFFRLQRQYNMQPKILVQYRRVAFERTELERVRANFDDELVGSRHLDLLGPVKAPRRILKYGNSIFEIKLDGGLPFWMHQLISKYNLQNQAFSKFCNSIRSEARFSHSARMAD